MEFLLGLSDEEKQRRIVRQRRLRRLFWALCAVLVIVQVVALSTSSKESQATVAQSLQTREPTSVAAAVPTLTPTSPPSPTPTPTATSTPLPSRTPTHTPAPTSTATSAPPATGHGDGAPDTALPSIRATERSFVLSGTGLPGEIITVLLRRSVIAKTEADETGSWRVEVPTEPLARGENALQVLSRATRHPIPVMVTFDPWWLEAPVRMQGTLGEGYACAPTVLGMALDYYHALDPEHAAPPTTDIVRSLKAQGFIDGYGADAHMLVNLAISYGYSHSFFYREWTQAHLLKMLDDGVPVIANVRIDMGTTGYGHTVMIIGLSPDGERIMVLDPTQGMLEYPWDTFDRSWSSFGPPYNHGMVVKP